MPIRKEIKSAICSATERSGQEQVVANKIVAWLEALSSGNESLEDSESVKRHLDLLFETIVAQDSEIEGGLTE